MKSVSSFRLAVTAFAALALTLTPLYPASAVVGTDWKSGRVMDDGVMRAYSSMTVEQVQTLLNSKLPSCDYNGDKTSEYGGPDTNGDGRVTRAEYGASVGNPAPYRCLKDYYENIETKENNLEGRSTPAGAMSAAQIIHYYAQQYKINPQAIIILLQKEQTLITDDWPWAIQYRSATGYGCPDTAPCSTEYYGFSNQVRWASRMFQAIIDNDPSWYSPYIKGSNYIQWNPNSGCGGTDVNVENWTTAALYSYTPYQPNKAALDNLYGLGDNCSAYGNRNFWRLFNDWFGSTLTVPYAWTYEGQTMYADSGLTQRITQQTVSLAPGQTVHIVVKARNTGNLTWTQDVVKLGTYRSMDRSSLFTDSTWLSANRIALLEPSIAPGSIGTFVFTATAPQQTGVYKEYFNLVAENATWLNDLGLYFAFDVTPTRAPLTDAKFNLMSGETVPLDKYLLSQDALSTLNFQNDGNLVLYTDFKPLWSSKTAGKPASQLSMQTDGNLVIYAADSTPLWSSGTAGNTGAYTTLQTDGNLVIYSASNLPLWSSGTSSVPNHLSRRVDYLHPRSVVYARQMLITANHYYRFILQNDGNLVLYTAENKPLWSSGTAGNTGAYATLQTDGNLVLYSATNKPLWSTGTAGKPISHLSMQPDGNLVLYAAESLPLWSSGTAGKR